MGDAIEAARDQAAGREALTCFECLYDLRGQPEGGVCPECGAAVAGSVRTDRWDWMPGGFRRKVRWGVALLPGELLILVAAMAVAGLMRLSGEYAMEIVLGLVTAAGFVGTWLVTAAWPAGESRRGGWVRWAGRLLAVLQVLPLTGVLVVRWTGMDIGGMAYGLPADVVLGLVWVVLVGVRHAAVMGHLGGGVLSRVPGQPLRRVSRWAWVMPLLGWVSMAVGPFLDIWFEETMVMRVGLACAWFVGALGTVVYGSAAWWALRREAGR